MSALLSPISAGYGLAAEIRGFAYRRGWLAQQRLARPVISVGNLSTGGTGKTPLVEYLARLIIRQGLTPAILTRGYGRRDERSLLVIEPAASRSPNPREAGDEPALLAQSLPQIPIVISADRFKAGRLAERRFSVGVHLLDDGFQHLRLERDLDIVALDVTQELSDRQVLPAGRLRERCSALRRADIIVLTRTDLADPAQTLARLAQLQANARVFHSKTRLTGFAEIATGRVLPPGALVGRRICAFCGVGNPSAFFLSLRRWQLNPVSERAFQDHHLYTGKELASLLQSARAANASALVTTGKDAMNIPAAWKSKLNAFSCAIEMEISEADVFERAVMETLTGP
ncbi:MAG: tetraacyldisaccharide 4'-kinase [Terriglobia bacterium]